MKKKYIIISTILFLFNINSISAACTNEEIREFKRSEDKYTVTFKKNTTLKSYDLYLTGPLRNKYNYRIISSYNDNCVEIDDSTTKCTKFPAGTYEIHIKGITNTCTNILKKINIEIPTYISYSDDPLCEGVEEFVLCDPDYDKEIDYETFVSRVNTYKKTQITNQEKDESKEKNENDKNKEENQFNIIKKNIKENWMEIAIVITFVILLLLTIIISVKSIRKSRRLE